jgi:hypothetical protein
MFCAPRWRRSRANALRGTTAIGAYSPRARERFPVAAPATWAQVERRRSAPMHSRSRGHPQRRRGERKPTWRVSVESVGLRPMPWRRFLGSLAASGVRSASRVRHPMTHLAAPHSGTLCPSPRPRPLRRKFEIETYGSFGAMLISRVLPFLSWRTGYDSKRPSPEGR